MMSQQHSHAPLAHSQMVMLAPYFVPGPYDVICSRGGSAKRHPGNQRYRASVEQRLHEYSQAKTKADKTTIVSAIVESVRSKAGPNGGFVKQLDDGFWYEVGDAAAREKTGQVFRDQLHTLYKSSTRAKKGRRDELKQLKRKQHKSAAVNQIRTVTTTCRRCSKEQIDVSLPSLLRLLSTGPQLWGDHNDDQMQRVTRAQQALLQRQRTDYLSKINISIPDVPTSWKKKACDAQHVEPLPASQRQSTIDHLALTKLLELMSSGPSHGHNHGRSSIVKVNSQTGKLDLIDENGDDFEIDLETLLHMMPITCTLCNDHNSQHEESKCCCL